MKIPSICTVSAPFNQEGAGWYTPFSVSVRDIRPDWRCANGFVTSHQFQSLPGALNSAIAFTKLHIAEAQDHLRNLELAKEKINT